MKTWYKITAKAETADISIYDEIGFWGVTAKAFTDELKALGKPKSITLSINSPGGSVFDALVIYNALRQTGAEITVRVMGLAASAASLVAMAGDKIIMPENTFMMVHDPLTFAFGDAEDLRDVATTLDKIGDSLVAIYVNRTGKTTEEIKALLGADTWMTAKEAVDLGFATEMEAAFKVAAKLEWSPEDRNGLPANVIAALTAVENAPAAMLADQISEAAAKAGFGDYAASWLGFSNMGQVQAAIKDAQEIAALCAVAKKPGMVPDLIRNRVALADARIKVMESLALDDESTNTDNTQPGGKPTPKPETKPFSISAIWEARRGNARS